MTSRDITAFVEGLPGPTKRPHVAFFDLDGTLISGYSIVALARETIKKSLSDREWRQSAKLMQDLLLRGYNRGAGSSYHRLVRHLSRALSGTRERALEDLGQSAFHHFLARKIFSEAVTLVEAHRRAGHRIVILTAATRYQAEPIARVLGIDDICCTRLEVQDGQFTGKVHTPMCFGEGKALAARRVLRDCGGKLKDAWFYEDDVAAHTVVTYHPGEDHWPVVSPDGTQVFFQSSRNGFKQLFKMPITTQTQTKFRPL